LIRPPKYPKHGALRAELNKRVDGYFRDNGLEKSGGWRLLVKALVIVTWFVASYVAAVFWAPAFWIVALLAVSMGLAQAGIGFSIMHDGGHGASSKWPWVNRVAAHALDTIGGSSKLWAFKHNIIHHQYPNVDGVDHDIIVEPWLRLTPTQKRRWFHRGQHLYFPLAYAFVSAKWLLHDDFATLIKRRLGEVAIPPVRKRTMASILSWKLFAIGWALVLPIALNGVVWTLGFYAIFSAVCGITLATVFQLAHMVEDTETTELPAPDARIPRTWALQQLATTMDFAPTNRFITWYVGGLNFQVEHHLFPRISHIHYPAIAPIVQDVCAEFDAPYHVKDSFFGAVESHRGHLRALGKVSHPERLVSPVLASADSRPSRIASQPTRRYASR